MVVLEQPRDRSKAAKLEKRKRFFWGRGGGVLCFFLLDRTRQIDAFPAERTLGEGVALACGREGALHLQDLVEVAEVRRRLQRRLQWLFYLN